MKSKEDIENISRIVFSIPKTKHVFFALINESDEPEYLIETESNLAEAVQLYLSFLR
jgi:copper(I)-binding protein